MRAVSKTGPGSPSPKRARKEAPAKTPRRSAEHSVRAVERTIAILNSFSEEQPEQNLTQIALQIGLSKPTVHRFLNTLEAGGMLARVNRSKSYRLGPALVRLSALSVRQFDLREIARSEMLGLAKSTGSVVHLGIFEDDSVVYIEKIEPTNNVLQLKSYVGSRHPLHCTALGKVLLASTPLEKLDQVLGRLTMTRFTDRTISSMKSLKEQLPLVRRQGFAIDNGEYNDLVRCVAVPIHDHHREVVCALSVSTVGVEVTSSWFAEIRDNVVAAGGRVSALLASASMHES